MNDQTQQLPVWQGTWALIRYRPGFFAVNLIFASAWLVTRIVPGWVEKLVYDGLVGGTATAVSLWGILGMLVAVEVGRLTCDVTGQWGGMRLRNAAGSLMQQNVMSAILRKPGAQPLPVSSGDAINRLQNDLADFADFPTWAPEVIGHGLFTLVALVVMFGIAPVITAVALLPLAGVFFLNRFAWSRFLRYGHESRAADSQVTGFLGEIFGAVQAVKVADAEAGTMGYFHTLNETRRELNVRYALFWALFQAANDHLGDIAVAVMVLLAGSAIANGSFSVGDFALFSSYLFFAARFPATIGSYISEIAQQRVVLNRVQEMVPPMPPADLVTHREIFEQAHREDELRPEIAFVRKTAVHHLESLEVRSLSYRYPLTVNHNSLPNTGKSKLDDGLRNTDYALQDISFTIPRGSFTVITGRIGAGKTTLLRALLGLLPAAVGEIYWNGQLVSEPATFFVPPRSAYTPQVPRLFSEPLRDNILMGLPETKVDLPGAIRQAVLEQDVSTLEKGLDTVVGPRGVRLSGGQVQRAAAARMFVRNAELLVFDDLSSALDVETERVLWERLFTNRQESKGTGEQGGITPAPLRPCTLAFSPTCLVVSHRRAALRRADQIIVLENGRIAAQGQLEDLLAVSPAMQAIWHGQMTGEQNHEDA